MNKSRTITDDKSLAITNFINEYLKDDLLFNELTDCIETTEQLDLLYLKLESEFKVLFNKKRFVI